MINEVLIVIVLLTSFPVGYLLAYLTKEEIVLGRRYFSLISAICIVLCFAFLLLINTQQKFPIIFSLIYIGFISLTCLKLSYNKRFVR